VGRSPLCDTVCRALEAAFLGGMERPWDASFQARERRHSSTPPGQAGRYAWNTNTARHGALALLAGMGVHTGGPKQCPPNTVRQGLAGMVVRNDPGPEAAAADVDEICAARNRFADSRSAVAWMGRR
jgi:hypothetical protein